MKTSIFYICSVLLFIGWVFGTENTPSANEVRFDTETLQKLRKGYLDYLATAKNLHEAVERARQEIPLLEATERAFKNNEEFRHGPLMDERQRYWEYLGNSTWPHEIKDTFLKCRIAFGPVEWAKAFEDPNQESVLKMPLLMVFRVQMSQPDQRKDFVESFERMDIPLPIFDVTEPNDNILWQNLKKLHCQRTAYLETQRKQLIKEKGVPQWLANYAGKEDFAQGAFEAYENGLLMLTPEYLGQALIKMEKSVRHLSHIYPRWEQMHHLLDEKYPENKALIEEAREHLQTWPLARMISPENLREK